MKDDQYRLLTVRQLPARLTAEQTSWLLNCQAHDIPILVAARLLKPLGNPLPSSVKFFATVELLTLAKDQAWLNKATAALGKHWAEKNRNRHPRSADITDLRPPDPDKIGLS